MVLNACFTLKHGQRLIEKNFIDSVVCASGEIEDRIARAFLSHFIQQCSVKETKTGDAFKAAVDLVREELGDTMDLKRAGIDTLVFLEATDSPAIPGGGGAESLGALPRWYKNSVCRAKTEHFTEQWEERARASTSDGGEEGKEAMEEEVGPDELRNYQNEMLARVENGDNRVLVLPTGAGKTLVAAKLCQRVASVHWEKVIIFAAQQIPLVFQQAEYLEAQTSLRVHPLCGAMEIHDWEAIMASNDIIVVTAGLLVNAFEANRVVLSEVSLLIFDEVHHATKRHPFNDIMQREFAYLRASRTSVMCGAG